MLDRFHVATHGEMLFGVERSETDTLTFLFSGGGFSGFKAAFAPSRETLEALVGTLEASFGAAGRMNAGGRSEFTWRDGNIVLVVVFDGNSLTADLRKK